MGDETRRSILITGCSSGIGHAAAHGARRARLAGPGELPQARGLRPPHGRRPHLLPSRLRGPAVDRLAASTRPCRQRAGASTHSSTTAPTAVPGAVEDLPMAALQAIFQANFFGWHELIRLSAAGHAGPGPWPHRPELLGARLHRTEATGAPTPPPSTPSRALTDTLRLELRGTAIHVVLDRAGPDRHQDPRSTPIRNFKKWIDWQRLGPPRHLRDQTDPAPRGRARRLAPSSCHPSAVVAKLIHALEAPRPRPRYYVTVPTYIMGLARRLLSTRQMDALTSRISS